MRDAVVPCARALLGVPFAHRGTSMNGMDCVGFVWCALRDAGAYVPEIYPYGRWAEPAGLGMHLSSYADEVELDAVEPGDIYLMSIGDVEQHLGIYTGDGRMIHVLELSGGNRGAVTEHDITVPWHRRLVSAWRWKDNLWLA